jgi:putative flippase GtrA
MDMNEIFNKVFLLKFIKFCLVGFSGIFVDFGITYFFKEVVKIQKYVANAIGFSLAATTNYFLNRIF